VGHYGSTDVDNNKLRGWGWFIRTTSGTDSRDAVPCGWTAFNHCRAPDGTDSDRDGDEHTDAGAEPHGDDANVD
jgi:hypothetical protein